MKIMFEDEIEFNGKQIWVHADFKIISDNVYVTLIRAYDMNPSNYDDDIEPTIELIQQVEEIITYELYNR